MGKRALTHSYGEGGTYPFLWVRGHLPIPMGKAAPTHSYGERGTYPFL